QDKEIADANQDAIKSGAFIKSTPTSQLGMVNKALGALSEGADAESVLKRYNSRVMEAVYNLPAFIAANEKAAAALKSRAAAGAKVETDEEKRRAQLKAADADGIKNSKFAEDSAVSRLKTVRQAFGALQREVSELTVIKRFGTDVLKATKDLASFEEAVKKANEEASAKKSTPQKQKSLDQLKEDNARLRTVASQRKVIQKEFEEANAAHTEKISSEDLRRHKLRGGAIFAEQKLDLDREAQQQAMRVRDAKFSDMSARQQLQQVRGVAAQIRKGVSEENIAKAFAPSAIAGVSDLAGFVKRAEDFRNANKKIKDTSVSDAKKADDLLQAQRDKNRAFEKLDAEQRLALAEKVAASRKALNSEAFIARKYAPLAIEASNDLPATRLKAEEFKAAQEQVKRLKALDDDRLRDLQRAGRERLAQEIKDAADVKALRKSQEREYDADVRKNNSFRKATPAAQLKTLTLARGELELGASEASVLKNYGSQVLESTKNIHAFEAANLKGSFALKGMTLDMNDAHAAARGLAGGFGQLWLTYGNVLPLLAGAAISAGFVAVVKQGAQVQNTFATIGALSEETDESVGKLNAQMLEMARSGPYGPREIAEAMKTLALAGLNAKEVSQSVGDVLRFAIAGDTDIQTSADVLTTVGVAFKMTADSYGYISDVIAKAAAISKSSVESIGSAFKTASVINAQYGASLEDVGLGLAFLANSGIQRTAAGTGLRNFYVDVLGRTPKAREELEAMAKSIGVVSIAMDTATGKALPLPQVLKNLNEAYKLMTPEREYKSKQDVFSERGGKVPFPLLDALNSAVKESNTTFDNFLDESMAKIENAAGFAAIAAAKMALTPLNQMKAVSSSLQATIVETFDSIAPQIIATTSLLREAFKSEEFKRGIVLAATALADF
ncbi:MAG: phage tail tape measure protein, partial [Betaproteobacteria bacterium]